MCKAFRRVKSKQSSKNCVDWRFLAVRHEVHWRKFFESLVVRGLHGAKLFVSDAHAGLKAARKAVFPSVPWQRC